MKKTKSKNVKKSKKSALKKLRIFLIIDNKSSLKRLSKADLSTYMRKHRAPMIALAKKQNVAVTEKNKVQAKKLEKQFDRLVRACNKFFNAAFNRADAIEKKAAKAAKAAKKSKKAPKAAKKSKKAAKAAKKSKKAPKAPKKSKKAPKKARRAKKAPKAPKKTRRAKKAPKAPKAPKKSKKAPKATKAPKKSKKAPRGE